jgi:hypothetical protein
MKNIKTFEQFSDLAINENRKISDSWQKVFTKWANEKSGDYELAMKYMERFWDMKCAEPGYDVNKYKSIEELVNDVDEWEKGIGSRRSREGFYRRNPGKNLRDSIWSNNDGNIW